MFVKKLQSLCNKNHVILLYQKKDDMIKKFRLQTMMMVISLGLLVGSCSSETLQNVVVQAHRGGAALFPENTYRQ